MAYIRSHTTTQKRKGKQAKRYEVVWREQATDPATGLPLAGSPTPMRARQESYATREAAEERRDELNAARHTTGTSTLADQRKAGAQTYGHYAAAWLAEQRRRYAEGTLKIGTLDNYEWIMARYVLPRFGQKAIGAITLVDCERFRADLAGRLSRRSVQNVWWPFAAVYRYAQRAGAITASPADAIDRATTARPTAVEGFMHRPLTGPQVAALAAKVGENTDPAYELLVLFMAYTGLRRGEVQGLEVRDLTLTTSPAGTKGTVRIQRTKTRRQAAWVTGTPKSKTSRRTVPLPPWLAERMAAYMAGTHGNPADPTAPLWPRRLVGGARHKGQRAVTRLDWAEPCDLQGLQARVIRPAQASIGLPPTRMHDLRHTAAVLWLTAGVHFMQVSKWLGHASYVITMTVYADYMPDAEAVNPLPEPVASATQATNVVPLRPARAGG